MGEMCVCVCVCVLFQVCADLIVANEGWTAAEEGLVRWLWPVGYASYCVRLCSIMCLICHNRSFRKLN